MSRLQVAEKVSGSRYQVSRPQWGNTQAAFLDAQPTHSPDTHLVMGRSQGPPRRLIRS